VPEIAAPRGTKDILPGDSTAYRWLLEAHREVAEAFGYRYIETPIYEHTELFARAVGTDTDIVEKQMFTFEDRGGRSLALRPEGTAGVMRAVLGARLDQVINPVRVHYQGPMFRAERPQAGRQHQFTQVGIECIGERSPHLDVETIEMAWRFFQRLAITGVHLQINSLGTPEDRRRYRAALVAYYEPFRYRLCDDCKRRLDTNPLRLLDCKKDADLVADAPIAWDALDETSRESFRAVQAGLAAASIEATVNPRLVRGLDYYTDTVFEFWHEHLHGAQNALGGGGRYDGLAAVLGLPDTPATGYALGIERILLIARELGVAPDAAPVADALVCSIEPAQAGDAARAARLVRSAGIRAVLDVSDRRLDRKLRVADKLGARVAVIVGEAEAAAASVVVRDLKARSQQTISEADLQDTVTRILAVDA
jgi:histidyl-tRNA synthetase